MFGKSIIGFSFISILLTGCTTLPPSPKVSHEEIIRRDQAVGLELSEPFEKSLILVQDLEIVTYIQSVAQTLVSPFLGLQGNPVTIRLIRGKKGTGNQNWLNYSLPGNRLYLSVGLLRKIDFENEIAGIIAIQLGHLLKKDVLASIAARVGFSGQEGDSLDHFSPLQNRELFQSLDYFGPKGIFNFPESSHIQAVQSAVNILYQAGYDPRGIVTICEIFLRHPSHSPYANGTLLKMIEKARREIAMYAPLRHPIVRSEKFLLLRKRIQEL